MNPYLVFGILSIVLGAIPFILLYSGAGLNPYVAWLSAWSLSAFVIYLIDKVLSKAGALRAPELVLNLLAVVGGFPGCWVGMLAFNHKSNRSKHPVIWLVLVASTIGHAALAVLWLLRG
jgi:uncharacterized membrane protein YsdA (DUF1294 family)